MELHNAPQGGGNGRRRVPGVIMSDVCLEAKLSRCNFRFKAGMFSTVHVRTKWRPVQCREHWRVFFSMDSVKYSARPEFACFLRPLPPPKRSFGQWALLLILCYERLHRRPRSADAVPRPPAWSRCVSVRCCRDSDPVMIRASRSLLRR